MDKRTTASARLEVVIDIPASGSWGSDCSLDQIYRQASEETRIHLSNILYKEFGSTAKIIGEPKIRAVITERT